MFYCQSEFDDDHIRVLLHSDEDPRMEAETERSKEENRAELR